MVLILILILFIIHSVHGNVGECLETTIVENCYPNPKNGIKCGNASICGREIHLTEIQLPLYDNNFVLQLFQACCGACSAVTTTRHVHKVSDISMDTMRDSDIAFPILGESRDKEIHGYQFLLLVDADDTFYITVNKRNKIYPLVTSAAGLWQLVVIILLLVIVAGFVCWVMETWNNEKDFPRALHLGWFEGIWWSFVSMTTVGYGDKVPKSFHTKIFSMVWILFGIATFPLITAQLLYEITDVHTKSHPIIPGKRVATIRHRLYEQIIVARNGGTLMVTSSTNISEALPEMVMLLTKGEVDGLLIDRLVAKKQYFITPEYLLFMFPASASK